MDPPPDNQRLSQIATQWSMLMEAHGGAGGASEEAIRQLAYRYCGAVYRYLLAAVRDPDVAADLSQEFALRLIRGDFRGACPERGRFRSYLKTTLFHLVSDFHRERRSDAQSLAFDVPEAKVGGEYQDQGDAEFLQSWRETLIERSWAALHADNPVYHATLQARIMDSDATSAELAERLSRQLGRPTSAAAVRKTLQRAHEKFGELLLDEVERTVLEGGSNALEAELRELDLLRYCKSSLTRRRAGDR
jgi:RNA polymerase sigma-70 factor (ECF subfamily)